MSAPFSGSRAGQARPKTADCFGGARGPHNEAIVLAFDGLSVGSIPVSAIELSRERSELTATPPEAMITRLQHYVAQVEGALAPNTIRAFRADMRAFTTWADANGGTLPATADQVVRFIEAMAADRAPATVRHYISKARSGGAAQLAELQKHKASRAKRPPE